MIVETATEIALAEPALLDHRAHRPVEHEYPSPEQAGEFGGMIGLHRECASKKQLSSLTFAFAHPGGSAARRILPNRRCNPESR
jgi:hypothetical protein